MTLEFDKVILKFPELTSPESRVPSWADYFCRMTAHNWFKDWFNSHYYHLLYKHRDDTEAHAFIDRIVHLLKPPPNAKMLDIACGKGRHSRALAQYGYDVTGIDLSYESIREARKFAHDRLHFFQHDMRMPSWVNYFDIAWNLFTSFGYFKTQREHEKAIRTMAQSIKPGGKLVMDYLNVHYSEDHLVPSVHQIEDGVDFHITKWHDEHFFYKQIQITDAAHPSPHHLYTERVAKFSLGDFTEMMAYEHLQIKEVYGDYQLAPYHIRQSPRLIMVAEKIK